MIIDFPEKNEFIVNCTEHKSREEQKKKKKNIKKKHNAHTQTLIMHDVTLHNSVLLKDY